MKSMLLIMSAVLLLGTPAAGHAIEVWYDGKHFESQEAYRQYRDSLTRQQIVQEPSPSLLTLALAPLAAAAWVLRWPRPRLSFATSRSRWGAAAMVVLLLAANWTWVIVAGGSGR